MVTPKLRILLILIFCLMLLPSLSSAASSPGSGTACGYQYRTVQMTSIYDQTYREEILSDVYSGDLYASRYSQNPSDILLFAIADHVVQTNTIINQYFSTNTAPLLVKFDCLPPPPVLAANMPASPLQKGVATLKKLVKDLVSVTEAEAQMGPLKPPPPDAPLKFTVTGGQPDIKGKSLGQLQLPPDAFDKFCEDFHFESTPDGGKCVRYDIYKCDFSKTSRFCVDAGIGVLPGLPGGGPGPLSGELRISWRL